MATKYREEQGGKKSSKSKRWSAPSVSQRAQREKELILRTTQAIQDVMKQKKITKSELAERMGKSRSFVTQILTGKRNLTLRTIADLGVGLDVNPRVILTAAHR